ncbi:MAG: phytanoyl-CoA dioxygenase family protein [bacterium]|nr:phytanoyl-CoA dioxygenase family protein [Gammaproteobacteria bacterium]HIL96173.1 phytanoyl-CoA dioxygenase family protein [Pseudomonadales bacterium]
MVSINTRRQLESISQFYAREGYYVAEGLVSGNEVEALCREINALVRGEKGRVIGTEVLDPSIDLMQQVLAIHFPHKASDLMTAALSHPQIVEILDALIGPDVKCMQSMVFAKNAGKPGQAWHQDEYFIPTRDRSLCGVWIALDDATIKNGCLWIHSGSQREGILWPMKAHNDDRFDISHEAYNFPFDENAGQAVEVQAGSVVFFNGYTLHRSLNNTKSSGYRRALVNHYMNARSLLPWGIGGSARNDFRDIVMVSGVDPYADKGIQDFNFPFIRAENPVQSKEIYALTRKEFMHRSASAE